MNVLLTIAGGLVSLGGIAGGAYAYREGRRGKIVLTTLSPEQSLAAKASGMRCHFCTAPAVGMVKSPRRRLARLYCKGHVATAVASVTR